MFLPFSQRRQRTTCIKAQKWPPTKLTHIVMNNSCVVPLTGTGMEIGDRHYIWGQNGVKGYDPQAILIKGNLHCPGICWYPVIIFFFLKGFELYIWHTKYFRNKCLVSVHLAICKSFRSSACSSICLLLDQSFVLNVFIAFISVTT